MKQSTLLVVNSSATYARMMVSAVIGLLITRLLFAEFGPSDYGLLMSLTASASLLTVIQMAMIAGSQRSIAFQLGRGDLPRVVALFSCTVVLCSLSALAILLVGLSVAKPVIRLLDVEKSQLTTAHLTFMLSVASLAIGVLATPARSLMQAHQSIFALSVIDLVDRFTKLGAVLALSLVPMSAMPAYMALTVAATTLTLVIMVLYACTKYADCRFRPGAIRFRDLQDIGGFGGWMMFETIAYGIRDQGAIIAMKSQFGGDTTAAYDLAQRLAGQLATVAHGVFTAIAPAAAAKQGAGDSASVYRLGNLTNRYCTLASSLFLVPLFLETPTVIRLWIGVAQPPEYAVVFVRLLILMKFFVIWSWGEALVAQARGRIGKLSVGLTLPFLFAFALSIVWLTFVSRDPYLLPAVMLVVTVILNLWYAPWLVRRMCGMSWSDYAHETLRPVLLSLAPPALIALAVSLALPEGLPRMLGVVAGYWSVLPFSAWWLGAENWERDFWKGLASKFLTRTRMQP